MTVPCPCTVIHHDDSCPVGFPSALCQACGGMGHLLQPIDVTQIVAASVKLRAKFDQRMRGRTWSMTDLQVAAEFDHALSAFRGE